MSVTRQALNVTCYVLLHGERPKVLINYDGHPGWRFYFDDAEELAVDLINAKRNDGLPQCAVDAALACVRDTIGSYDELFAHTETSCRITDTERIPPAAFQCWDRTRWYETAFDCFLFIGGAAFFIWILRVLR